MTRKLQPIHPGEVLLEDFLKPLNMSQYRLAKELGVPARRINEIIKGTRAITADTAIRLEKFFGMTSEFWINYQAKHDLEVAKDNTPKRVLSSIQPYNMQEYA